MIRLGCDPFGILIPTLEVLRFYYEVSTNLAHVIFSGALKHNLESVINIDKTGYHSEEKRFFLGLRKNYIDEEGWVLARILNSPLAWKAVSTVHDELMKQTLNGNFGYVKTAFTFSGFTDITARYKKIKSSDDQWRYLVLSLEYCTAAFPFKNLTLYRDNDGRGANLEMDIPNSLKKQLILSLKSLKKVKVIVYFKAKKSQIKRSAEKC